jgi:hypothetical protein
VATKGPTTFVAVRDAVLLAAGVLGIGFQQVTGEVNSLLLTVYMTMIGIPGLSSGLWLLKQIGEKPSSSPPSSHSSGEPPAESQR